MMSGVKAGLVSADVLRREQQELKKRERSNKRLEGRGLKPLTSTSLLYFSLLSAGSQCCVRPCPECWLLMESSSVEQHLDMLMDSWGSGQWASEKKTMLINGDFKAMLVK